MSRSRGSSALRRAVVVALTLPLVGAALVATAPGASADITQPGRGAEYSSQSSRVSISADFGRSTGSGTQRLYLTPPGGSEIQVAVADGSVSGGTLAYSFDLDCWTTSCTLARNGSWTIRQEGSPNASSFFVTRIRPAAPTSVAATAISSREVRLSWRRGAEPDLTGFEVLEGNEVVKPDVGLGACDGSTCSAVVSYATDGSGDHSYTVRAFRSTGPGSGSTLDSPLSAPASARLEAAAPSPQPAPSDDTTGDTTDDGSGAGSDPGGSTGGSAGPGGSPTPGSGSSGSSGSTGGTDGSTAAPIGTEADSGQAADEQAVAQRKAFALSFSAFGPKLGIPKLPPLPQQAPAIAPELADGSYEPTLGFEDQVFTERVEVAQGPTQRVRNVVGTALDSERLATSTAAALVLLMLGAHLRRWLGAAHEEH